jgi:hypothetical protein
MATAVGELAGWGEGALDAGFISAPELHRFVMVFRLRTFQAAVLHDVPRDGNGGPYQRHRAQHINAIQDQHRREDNKGQAGQAAPIAASLSSQGDLTGWRELLERELPI